MNLNLKPYFERKKIIHTSLWKPGVLVKRFVHEGHVYVRIAFPNLKKSADTLPITDVLLKDVTAIRVLPSRFEKWFWGKLGVKKKGRLYKINHPTSLK